MSTVTANPLSLRTDKAGSLLAAGVQISLMPVEDMPDEFWSPSVDGCPGQPRYTARLFFRRRPEDYQRAVQLLGAGMQLTEVARLLRVHHRTIAAVRVAEFEKVDTYKQTVISDLRIAVEVLAGDLADGVHALPLSQKPLALAVLTDKLAMLEESGSGGVQGDPVTAHLTHNAILAAVSQLPALDVETHEVLPTGSEVAMGAQKGLGAPSGSTPGATPTTPRAD